MGAALAALGADPTPEGIVQVLHDASHRELDQNCVFQSCARQNEEAFEVLEFLATADKSLVHQVSVLGGVLATIHAMRARREQARFQLWATNALTLMVTANPQCAEQLVEHHGLKVTVDALVSHANDVMVQRGGAAVVSAVVVVNPPSYAAALQNGVIKHLVNAAQLFPDDEKLLRLAMETLARMCSIDTKCCHEALKHQTHVVLAPVMTNLMAEKIIIRSCCSIFCALVGASAKDAEKVVKCGGLTLLVKAAKAYPHDAKIVWSVCCSIAAVARSNHKHRRMIMEAGGGQAIVAALTELAEDHKICKMALSSLALCTAGHADPPADAARVIVRIMNQHPKDGDVQNNSAWALVALAECGVKQMDRCVRASAIPALLRILAKFDGGHYPKGWSFSIQRAAVTALLTLSPASQAPGQLYASEGLRTLLEAFCNTKNHPMQVEILHTLLNVSGDKHVVKAACDLGVVDLMADALEGRTSETVFLRYIIPILNAMALTMESLGGSFTERVPAIIDLALQAGKNMRVRRVACELLTRCSLRSISFAKAFVQNGGVVHLLSCLEGDAGLVAQVFGALGRLAPAGDHGAFVFDEETAIAMLESIKRHQSVLSVARNALVCILEISRHHTFVKALISQHIVKVLVTIAEEHEPEAEIAMLTAAIMERLAKDSMGTLQLAEEDAPARLVTFCQRHGTHPACVQTCLGVVALMAVDDNPESRSDENLLKAGMGKVIIELMEKNADQAAVMRTACVALGGLGEGAESHSTQLAEEGCFPALLRALSDHKTDARVVRAAADALVSILAYTPKRVSDLVHNGVVKTLTELLSLHKEKLETSKVFLDVMACMLSEDCLANTPASFLSQAFIYGGIVPIVLAVTQLHKEDLKLVKAGIVAFGRLMEASDMNDLDLVVEQGATAVLAQAVALHGAEGKITRPALTSVVRILGASKASVVEVVKSGMALMCVKVLKHHSEDPRVLRTATTVVQMLISLTSHGGDDSGEILVADLLKTGIVKSLVHAYHKRCQDPRNAKIVCELLESLALSGDEGARAIVEHKGLELIIEAVVPHAGVFKVKRPAMATLEAIAGCNDEYDAAVTAIIQETPALNQGQTKKTHQATDLAGKILHGAAHGAGELLHAGEALVRVASKDTAKDQAEEQEAQPVQSVKTAQSEA
mmetsp:Transcript_16226/g.41408  ORF Transcript_16226/g.41408 Transcript_16226/m.41408 type:complete len:1163 (-) Transcript_16226:155-3643(-)